MWKWLCDLWKHVSGKLLWEGKNPTLWGVSNLYSVKVKRSRLKSSVSSFLWIICLCRPPLRGFLLDGDFFVAASLATTLTKIALRYVSLVQEKKKQNVSHLLCFHIQGRAACCLFSFKHMQKWVKSKGKCQLCDWIVMIVWLQTRPAVVQPFYLESF